MADLADVVVEQVGHDGKGTAGDNGDASLLSVGDLEDSARGELSDDIVLLTAAVHELHENATLQGLVQFVSLMEVIVDFLEDLLSQNVVFALHLLNDFV